MLWVLKFRDTVCCFNDCSTPSEPPSEISFLEGFLKGKLGNPRLIPDHKGSPQNWLQLHVTKTACKGGSFGSSNVEFARFDWSRTHKKKNNTHSAILGTVSREHRIPLVSGFSKREGFYENYSPKINECPLKIWSFQKEKIVFPPLFFRGHACVGGESYANQGVDLAHPT